ncbi:tetratricopeptide repeat protein 24 isoform X2 [Amia ocellicauda]|uniref:tetratricopeptide repeat protein 24 isoform X2 n=1 Tax=Amia ocellicauda TaxID=2972642 RepID=UPI0034640E85
MNSKKRTHQMIIKASHAPLVTNIKVVSTKFFPFFFYLKDCCFSNVFSELLFTEAVFQKKQTHSTVTQVSSGALGVRHMTSSAVPVSAKQGEEEVTTRAEIERLTRAGKEAMKDDRQDQALFLFKKAFLLSCKLLEGRAKRMCLFNLGAAYVAAGNAKKGLKCFVKCKLMDPEDRNADMHFNIAIAYDHMEEYAKAARFYQKVVSCYSPGQGVCLGDTLLKLGYCSVSLGDTDSAASSFRQAGRAYQGAGRMEDAAVALRESANHAMHGGGSVPRAQVLDTLRECLQMCESIADPSLRGKLLNDVGLHYAELLSFCQAAECFQEALGCSLGQSSSARKRAVLLQNIGAMHNALAQYPESLQYHAEAADMYRARGERKGQGECLSNLAYAVSQMKNYQSAVLLYRGALQAFSDVGDLQGQWQMCEGLGATHFCLGNTEQAISYYKQALTLFGKSKDASSTPRERILSKLKDVTGSKGTLQPSHSLDRNLSPSNKNPNLPKGKLG